jgi:hypothetical protein
MKWALVAAVLTANLTNGGEGSVVICQGNEKAISVHGYYYYYYHEKITFYLKHFF